MPTDNDTAETVPLPAKPKRAKAGNRFRLYYIMSGGEANEGENLAPVNAINYPSTKAARAACKDEGRFVTILIRDRFEVETVPQEPVRKITTIK